MGVIPAQLGGGGGGSGNGGGGSGGGGGASKGEEIAVSDGDRRPRSASVVAKAASNNQIYSIPFETGDTDAVGLAEANHYLVPQATNAAEDAYDMPDATAKYALPTSASWITYSVPNAAGNAVDDDYDMPDAAAQTTSGAI